MLLPKRTREWTLGSKNQQSAPWARQRAGWRLGILHANHSCIWDPLFCLVILPPRHAYQSTKLPATPWETPAVKAGVPEGSSGLPAGIGLRPPPCCPPPGLAMTPSCESSRPCWRPASVQPGPGGPAPASEASGGHQIPPEPPSSRRSDAHTSLQQHRALGAPREAQSNLNAAIPLHIFNLLDKRIQSSLSASPQGPQNPAEVPTSHFLQQPGGQEFTR